MYIYYTKKMCDILSLDANSKGRDTHILEPVLVYLEKKYKLQIIRASILEGVKLILLKKPKMLLLPNNIGSPEHFRISKFASKLKIKIVTLDSEGDYQEHAVESFFWGWNKDQKIYFDLKLLWSERAKKMIQNNIKNIDMKKIDISGGTGFDRYKLLKFKIKDEIGREINKKLKKVILVSGWGFDLFYSKNFSEKKVPLSEEYIKNKNFYINSRIKLNKILKETIEKNKEITFILKIHPMVFEINKTEFEDLDKYENVVFIKNEIEISDLLNIADIIFAFESTTCLEGWLLNKKTILINPCGDKFARSIISNGSPKCKNYEEVQKYINEYYLTGNIEEFERLENVRKDIIKDVIGYDDGKNYIRAGERIIEILNKKNNKKIQIDSFVIKEIIKYIVYRLKRCLGKSKSIWDYSKIQREEYIKLYKNVINYSKD
ncbi:BFO_1060 family glycosyltransferase [Fusobacterium varium]|uniref:BFO_1060 family glycosyltransferase n=1 Tax=Fusobacterium varium TaxID=856 RepID=UPI003569A257